VGDILTLEQAVESGLEIRQAGGALVLTNGHFDLLHVGHLDYLERARALGTALFVGVNGDGSTRQLKGSGRPLVPALERARLLAALAPVTACIVFEADTATALVEALRPEVYAKGGDYAAVPGVTAKLLPERPAVEAYGGRVVLLDYLPDHSTSALIARVRALPVGTA
jgi:rfaE bifunctional protein nucleotidyltransferase chain/domain